MSDCIDCGDFAHGLRCHDCSAKMQLRRAAERLDTQDRELLAMRERGNTLEHLAAFYGVSRNAIHLRLAKARKRQRALAE